MEMYGSGKRSFFACLSELMSSNWKCQQSNNNDDDNDDDDDKTTWMWLYLDGISWWNYTSETKNTTQQQQQNNFHFVNIHGIIAVITISVVEICGYNSI